GRDLHGGFHLAVIDDFQFRDADAGIIKQDFFGIGQPGAVKEKHHVGAALPAAWRDAAQTWRRGVRPRRHARHKYECQEPPPEAWKSHWNSRHFKIRKSETANDTDHTNSVLIRVIRVIRGFGFQLSNQFPTDFPLPNDVD